MRHYTSVGNIGIVLPNGTRIDLQKVDSIVLEWTVVERTGNQIRLNVTFLALGRSYTQVNINHSKTLFVDVDLYTRESSIDGESIGKTCFWVEPYREAGDNITLFTDPDHWIGSVSKIRTADDFKIGMIIKYCAVEVRRNDPNAQTYGVYAFSYWTGVSLYQTLIGAPWIVPPELFGNFRYKYDNGTEYNITRFAGIKIGERLGIAPQTDFPIGLNRTNIDLTIETQPDSPDTLPSVWQYAPYIAAAVLVTTTAATIILRRRKHNTKKGKGS
ncbi:hypothetical protein A3K79_01335 [Candidatus Bathyarchaeota archaeon RBG_13_46_16b]|nr:MAG: hypothetical protein A3K79_01335 [Candidatus Bathyarchaeota archaeon RBG_13_46_16b]